MNTSFSFPSWRSPLIHKNLYTLVAVFLPPLPKPTYNPEIGVNIHAKAASVNIFVVKKIKINLYMVNGVSECKLGWIYFSPLSLLIPRSSLERLSHSPFLLLHAHRWQRLPFKVPSDHSQRCPFAKKHFKNTLTHWLQGSGIVVESLHQQMSTLTTGPRLLQSQRKT